ncbi:hypothetical protein [Bacillus wiedmannii]|uniref:hypothetical protein n=1 Tax=Bacillus wiedmannii TaxID=1890302 RepID=UPI000BF005C6|nr:hypothetical protein [Bacillus wiedmannii]PEL85853.1 hypothetical protein CN626_27030 [Bacillus wiedmannii]
MNGLVKTTEPCVFEDEKRAFVKGCLNALLLVIPFWIVIFTIYIFKKISGKDCLLFYLKYP